MPRGKSKTAKPWERLLQVMVNGDPIRKEDVSEAINYDFMYRLSSLVLEIKLHGGTIKVVKDGRKVVSYQLTNSTEMMKYLASRGFSPAQVTASKSKVKKLKDLNAKETETVSEEIEITEVVETQE